MTLFHISHTDLDGYGCQLLTKEYFKSGHFLNANYGTEVKLSIELFLNIIKEQELKEEILFLISDVNLTINESKYLDNEVIKLNDLGYQIKLQLLDHHATGEKCAQKYDWYFLDIKRCATKIVYDYLLEEYDAFKTEQDTWIKPLVDAINAVDIWLDHEIKNFEVGKVLLSMVSKVREVNNVLFAKDNRDFRIHLLKEAAKYIELENGHIKLDSEIHTLKKSYLKLDDQDDTLDNLSAKYLVNSLDKIKEELTVTAHGQKGLLTYTLGSISIPANAFLKANEEYDFFIDVSKRGHASFRADGKFDVAKLASNIAKGGGHVNASGGRFDDFKDSINYQDIRKYIQNKLSKTKKN